MRNDPERDESLETIQLLEGSEYRYQFRFDRPFEHVRTDRMEVFAPDDSRGDSGRLRPGLHTGGLPVGVFLDDLRVGDIRLEVRSRKLDYIRQYRWMLRDIASALSEVVMERFAVSEQAFLPDASRDAATLYQRFAFLQSLLADEMFGAAIGQVLARPHVSWVEEVESVPLGRGGRASSALAQEISRAGPRVALLEQSHLLDLVSLPVSVSNRRTEATVDNVPNQFVKFALTRWRDVVADVAIALEAEPTSSPVARGVREARALGDSLDALLSEELFRELGALSHFPAGNQVLQKRVGYRDLFQAYIEFELAAQLAWSGGSAVYGAGQRDVATLYEYWVFLQMAQILSALCSESFDFSTLLETRADGLGIDLRRGRTKVLKGAARRLGRELRIELWFNRTFNAGQNEAWTRPMRPDLSVQIHPGGDLAGFEPIWIHFDAKYRVDRLLELFGGSTALGDTAEGNVESESTGRVRRDDLLKMHAYRDAIRRSASASVVYPGTENEHFQTFHELLPGLGAFALQPTADGYASGTSAISRFLEDVFVHVASQVSQHERGRYWSRQVYHDAPIPIQRRQVASFLTRPPADTRVLLGYVKSADHLEWIYRTRLYNLRAGARSGGVELSGEELGAEIVVLYGPGLPGGVEVLRIVGDARVITREQMEEFAYPTPGGSAYLCLSIEKVDPTTYSEMISPEQIFSLKERIRPGARKGTPVVTTWLELLRPG